MDEMTPVTPDTTASATTSDVAPGEAVVQPTEQQTEAAKDFQPAAWQDSLPAGWREHLTGMNSLDDALNAMKRGMSYQPATEIDQLMTTPPEGVEIDPEMNKSFRELGVKIGLTQSQAQALVDFEVQQFAAAEKAAAEAATEELRKMWGMNYEANSAKATKAMLSLDAKMGNRLSAALGEGGLKNNPALVEAFSLIGSMISEDSLAGSSFGGSGQLPPETAESMFKSLFNGGK